MSALEGLFDVVEHLVEHHQGWNAGLSKVEAVAKLAAARAALYVGEGEAVADDAVAAVQDVSKGDAQATEADVKKLVDDAETLKNNL
jgi:hypothetical protein